MTNAPNPLTVGKMLGILFFPSIIFLIGCILIINSILIQNSYVESHSDMICYLTTTDFEWFNYLESLNDKATLMLPSIFISQYIIYLLPLYLSTFVMLYYFAWLTCLAEKQKGNFITFDSLFPKATFKNMVLFVLGHIIWGVLIYNAFTNAQSIINNTQQKYTNFRNYLFVKYDINPNDDYEIWQKKININAEILTECSKTNNIQVIPEGTSHIEKIAKGNQ